jgi:hypothetical protein
MSRYRKKPVEIDAMRYDGSTESIAALSEFTGRVLRATSEVLVIETLEGNMIANPGDWIIRGIQGEFYPCKPDIFEATYERVIG